MTNTFTFTFTYPCSTHPNSKTIKLTLPVSDIEVDGIDHDDAPDYCDAFISSALINGRKANDAELDQLQEDSDLVLELVETVLY